MSESVKNEQRNLRTVGFPISVDGKAGPRTRQARRDFRRAQGPLVRTSWKAYQSRLKWSAAHGGVFSRWNPHFKYSDWKSNGNGWIKVDARIVRACEAVRRCSGPFGIISGYRDPLWNARVGGASDSQHMYGLAADCNVPIGCASRVADIHGIGICSGGNTRACHIDVRSGVRVFWNY